jgi:hypothetical protein
MQAWKYTRARDRSASEAGRTHPAFVEPSDLVGDWVNTDKATRGIVRLVLTDVNGTLKVRAFGACNLEPCDWGEVKTSIHSIGVDSQRAVGFKAYYDFQFMETMLAAYLNKRILVVDSYNTFKDQSGRPRYFWRDHFHQ